MFRRVFYFFVFSNLFIATCAALMVYQTCHLLLKTGPDIAFTCFVFFATICSYSFHWYLTPSTLEASPRITWLISYRYIHTVFFIIGLAGAIVAGSFVLPHWPWLVLAAVTTFLYSAPKIPHPWFKKLRKIAVGKTIFLAMTWMYVTTLLPLLISDHPWRTEFTLFAISRFFLIYAICVLFDYRDREYDKSIGIRSLITWMGERAIGLLFVLSLLVFAGATAGMLFSGFSPLIVFILLIPGLITGGLYRYAINHSHDLLYYFILDGLMALSALTLLIPG